MNIDLNESTFVDIGDQENSTPQMRPPLVIYHESLRYIRLSQVTEDLFDSFRNMYLAFELLLEFIAKKQGSESERIWLKRALNTVNSITPLNTVYPVKSSDIVDDIYKNIYINIRCRLFHAKRHSRLMPHNVVDRNTVLAGLDKLTPIVLLLAENWLHAKRPPESPFPYNTNNETKPAGISSIIIVSRNLNSMHRKEGLGGPVFANAIPLETENIPRSPDSDISFALGAIEDLRLEELKHFITYGLVVNGHLLFPARLETVLKTVNINRLEIQIGLTLNNISSPKRLFTAS